MIEVCGNLIADLSKHDERGESHKSQINAFFDVLEERFLDVNPYCRCRAFQVFVKLCDLETKFPKRRQAVAELATRSLGDKSSNVRRNAIKLLSKLVTTHPFSVMHGGQLSYLDWKTRHEAVQTELEQLEGPAQSSHLGEAPPLADITVDDELLDDATNLESSRATTAMSDERRPPPPPPQQQQQQENEGVDKAANDAASTEALARLQLTKRYYTEALSFIQVLHLASPTVCQLLSAKNKSEVIEAMDFFVVIDAYKVETARTGIRRMLRSIWTKGNSDEGKGVQTHLIECYKALFFEAPESFSVNDTANYVARSMISLTFGASPAELTCLEQLLGTMMKAGHISGLVVSKLWQVYGVQKKEVSRNQRRGSIIVLGMLALADPQIAVKELETIVRIGLGVIGRTDLALAKYSCVALTRINPTRKQGKGALNVSPPREFGLTYRQDISTSAFKVPNDHAFLGRLATLLELATDDKEWFVVREVPKPPGPALTESLSQVWCG